MMIISFPILVKLYDHCIFPKFFLLISIYINILIKIYHSMKFLFIMTNFSNVSQIITLSIEFKK
jgi:hypothetical protein